MTHWINTKPVARKEHLCDDCGRTIRRGESYRRGSGMDGATAWTWRECEHCMVLASHVCRVYRLDEYSPDWLHDWEPETVEQLRIKVHFRKRWTRADGSLYPAPKIEWLYREDDDAFPYAARLHGGDWKPKTAVAS